MSQINKPLSPQNLVANIVDKTVYLERMTSRMIVVVKEMGAFQTNYGSELVWLIECPDKDMLIKTLLELNQLGRKKDDPLPARLKEIQLLLDTGYTPNYDNGAHVMHWILEP